MYQSERELFEKLVLRYLRNWDKKPDEGQLDFYWEVLKERSLSDIRRAFDICVKHSKYAPRPADILRKVTGAEGEGGTVAVDRLCQHPGCKRTWISATAEKRLCGVHIGSKLPNALQMQWREVMGAACAIDKIGEAMARLAYGDHVVDLIFANPQNDWKSPATWTVEAA